MFIVKSAIIFVLWLLIKHLYLLPDGKVNDQLTTSVVKGTTYGLNLLGYNTDFTLDEEREAHTDYNMSNVIFIDGRSSVLVGDACNGLELIVLFVGFLIAFPGRLKFKLVYIVIGSIILFLINIGREVLLALNYNFFRQSFDLNHKYTFALLVYAVVFILWKHWIKRYSVISTTSTANQEEDEAS